MERLSIQGDYFDSQLYGGYLYLWTFNGSLRVYNYYEICKHWMMLMSQNEQRHRHGDLPTAFRESQYCISEVDLTRFLIYERPYLTEEFPIGTEFIFDRLYEANALGLFVCEAPLFKELGPTQKIWDSPLISVNGARQRGLICSAGSDGVFWLPPSKREQKLLRLSDRQSIMSSFCAPGIYVQTSIDEPFLLRRENHTYGHEALLESSLFPVEEDRHLFVKLPRMTWAWKNDFYLAEGHTLQVFEFVEGSKPRMRMKKQVEFFQWKGDFVSAGTCDMGTVIELDYAVFLFNDLEEEGCRLTIEGPVTRWRLFPRSRGYQSHVHIILNDRLDIVDFRNAMD